MVDNMNHLANFSRNKALLAAGIGAYATALGMRRPLMRKGYLNNIAKESNRLDRFLNKPKNIPGKVGLGIGTAALGYGLWGGGFGAAEAIYINHINRKKKK